MARPNGDRDNPPCDRPFPGQGSRVPGVNDTGIFQRQAGRTGRKYDSTASQSGKIVLYSLSDRNHAFGQPIRFRPAPAGSGFFSPCILSCPWSGQHQFRSADPVIAGTESWFPRFGWHDRRHRMPVRVAEKWIPVFGKQDTHKQILAHQSESIYSRHALDGE